MKSEQQILSELRRGLETLKNLAIFEDEPIQYQAIRTNAKSALFYLDVPCPHECLAVIGACLKLIVASSRNLDLNISRNREINSLAGFLLENFRILGVSNEV